MCADKKQPEKVAGVRPKRRLPRRKWWQILLRISVVGLLVAIFAWATLPWWLPKEFIRQKIANDLAGQMGLEVKVGSLSISWGNGVEISGLSIASPEGFGQNALPMIEIDKINCNFSPFDLLLDSHIDWMEIVSPTIRAVVDDKGNLNLTALKKLQPDIETQRVSVTNAAFSLKLPDHDRNLLLRVSDLEFSQGKLNQLGQITMTAVLDQNNHHAPINLRVASGSQARSEAIDAAFHFANLDLSQIPLPRQPDFPIREISGRCSGSLSFKISDNLQVEQLSLELLATDLNFIPHVSQKIPTIERAGLQLSAAVEAASERIKLSSIHLHLPGVDITGQAGIYPDILTDGFDAVESFNFQGQIQPSQIATLLTGRRELPGQLEITGQLVTKIIGLRDGDAFAVSSATQGDNIIIRRGSDIIKPAGKPMTLQLNANVQPMTNAWVTNLNKCNLSLGQNSFTVTATIITPTQPDPANSGTQKYDPLKEALLAIERIRARGTFKISQLDELRNLLPSEDRDKLEFDGIISGRWFVGGNQSSRIIANMRAGRETHIRFGDILYKPKGREMTIDAACLANARAMELQRLAIECNVDNSWAGLDETSIQLSQHGRNLEIKGDFEVNGLEKILACFPVLSTDNFTLSQSFNGFFTASLGNDRTNLTCSANLNRLDIRAGDFFVKPSGKPMEVTVQVEGQAEQADMKWTLTSRTKTSQATFDTQLKHTQSQSPETSIVFGANIDNLAWLRNSSPALARILKDTEPEGKLTLAGRVENSQGKTRFLLASDSDKLSLMSSNKPGLVNLHSEPFAFNAKGSFDEKAGPVGDALELIVDKANFQINNHKLDIRNLQATIQPNVMNRGNQVNPLAGLQKLNGEISLACDLGKLSEEIVLRENSKDQSDDKTFGGWLVGTGRVSLAENALSFSLDVDGRNVSINDLSGLTKAAGQPGKLSLLITVPEDLSTLQIRNFRAQLGDVFFDGDAQATLVRNEHGLPKAIKPTESHFAVWSNRAQTLAELLPAWKKYNPAGDFFADIRWQAPQAGISETEIGTIASATLYTRNFQAEYKGRPVMTGGTVLLENIRLSEEGTPELARFYTDDLELRAGKNHAWLLADISSVTDQPKGQFHALMEYLDVADITSWLSEAAEKKSYTADTREALARRAEDIVTSMRNSLRQADISGRITAETFGIFDEKVEQHYMTQQLDLSLTVKDSKIDLAYMTGICGGLTRGRLTTKLNDERPIITSHVEFADVISTPSIQPQIMMYFPGNTVSGTFSRDEYLTYPLRDMIANSMDVRYRIIATGKAKMIATDGVVVGRSAPKFITKVFPGLNLTKYPYQTMTGYSKFLPDGTAENETFFFGSYDIYMEGTTDAENNVDYTLGTVLFGSTFSPEALRDWKQGRIPILKVKGKIENGKLVDETVSYPWPNETLFEIFLKNNLVYRAWVNMKHKRPPMPANLP